MGEIVLHCRDNRVAISIAKSLSPDNVHTEDLSVDTETVDGEIRVSVKAGNMGTFLATIDDLLSCAHASIRALHAIEK